MNQRERKALKAVLDIAIAQNDILGLTNLKDKFVREGQYEKAITIRNDIDTILATMPSIKELKILSNMLLTDNNVKDETESKEDSPPET